jgi:hypothetical protein
MHKRRLHVHWPTALSFCQHATPRHLNAVQGFVWMADELAAITGLPLETATLYLQSYGTLERASNAFFDGQPAQPVHGERYSWQRLTTKLLAEKRPHPV